MRFKGSWIALRVATAVLGGLADGGTGILLRGKSPGAVSILRLLFHWCVALQVFFYIIDTSKDRGPAFRILEKQNRRTVGALTTHKT